MIFSLKIRIFIFLPDELLNYGRLLETTLNEADTTLPASDVRTRTVRQIWQDALGSLHTWKRGSQRAVHKPLLSLLLIARASSRANRRVRFAEIENGLEILLRDFGPPRKSYHPEFPFWHLQTDGFWEVEAADELPKKTGGSSPTRSTLRKAEATGSVPDHLWQALVTQPDLRSELTEKLLYCFWPETYHRAIRTAIGLPDKIETGRSEKKGRRDPSFREAVLRAYERRCAICGYDGRLANSLLGLEAAHVKWWAFCGPDDISNGIALCSLHHVALDAGAISLGDNLTILVSAEVNGGTMVDEYLRNFTSCRMHPPQPAFPTPDPAFLDWHRKEVFRKPPREFAYASQKMPLPIAADKLGKSTPS